MIDPEPRAYPSTAIDQKWGGMTLHEWYVGQAVAGWLASFGDDTACQPAGVAQFAYEVADALMAERARRKDVAP